MVTDPTDILRDWLNAIVPTGQEGYLHTNLATGIRRTADGRYEHEKFNADRRAWHWPDQGGDMIAWMLESAPKGDVYLCPNLMISDDPIGARTKGGAVVYQHLHSDADHGLDPYDVEYLGGHTVSSGTVGHGHVHIPLAEPVTQDQYETMQRKLKERLGADSTGVASSVIRPPRTKNHKATVDGGKPTDVELLTEPCSAKKKPHELAAEFRISWSDIATVNGERPSASGDAPAMSADAPRTSEADDAPASMSVVPPTIIEELDYNSGDRSKDIDRIVKACYDIGLTLGQTRWCVGTRTDLVAKLGELKHDDVLRIWRKVSGEWPHPEIRAAAIKAIVEDATAAMEAAAKPSRLHMRDRLLNIEQLSKLTPTEPLIDGLIYRDTLAQLSGPPGSYKTFVSVSMACCVATGTPLLDHDVPERGMVVYVVAEGANDLYKRIAAWCETTGVDPAELADWLRVLPLPIQLGDRMDVSEAIEVVQETHAKMMVLDTRARCTLGMDENSATEQGRAIANAELIREAANCTVLAIHHTPRTGNAGRGSNAWDGAVWSDLRISAGQRAGLSGTKNGLQSTYQATYQATIHCEKHKDVESGCDHDYVLTRHVVSPSLLPGLDDKRRTTLVLCPESGVGLQARLTNARQEIGTTVWDLAPREGLTATDLIQMTGVSKSRLYDATSWGIGQQYLANIGTAKRSRFVPGKVRPPWLP